MSRRYPRKPTPAPKPVGRPPLPRWPEIHPRFHDPRKLTGIDRLAYELATGQGARKGEEAPINESMTE